MLKWLLNARSVRTSLSSLPVVMKIHSPLAPSKLVVSFQEMWQSSTLCLLTTGREIRVELIVMCSNENSSDGADKQFSEVSATPRRLQELQPR